MNATMAQIMDTVVSELTTKFIKPTEASSLDKRDSKTPIKTIDPIHRAMAVYKAKGFTNKQIASQFGYTAQGVLIISKQPWFKDLVAEVVATSIEPAVTSLSRMANRALEVQEELLESKNESIKLQVSDSVLDRQLGKAVQRTESISRVLSVNATLDELNAQEAKLNELLLDLTKVAPAAAS